MARYTGGEVAIVGKKKLFGGKRLLRKHLPGFHIGRYPVTVAQYRAFIEAKEGWRNPAWWGGDLHRDPEGKTYEFGRFGNYPAVCVNWFDAVAFCRWLSRRLGFTVRMGMAAGVDRRRPGSEVSVGRRLGRQGRAVAGEHVPEPT